MRMLIYSAIKASGVAGGRVYEASALGTGDDVDRVPENPEKPYVLIKAGEERPFREVRRTSHSSAKPFQVFVYDLRGSFVRIDDILRQIRDTVLGLELQVSPSGARCTEAIWLGISTDIPDAEKDQNIKFATFQLTSNQ